MDPLVSPSGGMVIKSLDVTTSGGMVVYPKATSTIPMQETAGTSLWPLFAMFLLGSVTTMGVVSLAGYKLLK
jgi:hypothetical protein